MVADHGRQEFIGDGTMEVNLEGKVIVPGLIDSHVHFISGGLQMGQVGLRGVRKKDEFCKMVKDTVQNTILELQMNSPGKTCKVADINPLHSLRTAMKGIPPKWDHAWIPSERISFTDALIGHTISAGRAAFLDHHLGSLSPGKLADFVVLSTNSCYELTKESSASVLETYVGGKQVYP